MSAPLDGLDLNLLVTLNVLLRDESVTRAAQQLGTTQPTVSRALATLRLTFDDPLLVRSGRAMAITPLGQSLRRPLEQALSSLERLRGLGTFDPTNDARHFRLIIPDILAVVLLPSFIQDLAQRAPEVTLSVFSSERTALSDLLSGNVDLVLAAPALEHPELHTRKISQTMPWSVVYGPKHPCWPEPMTLQTWQNSERIQLMPREQVQDDISPPSSDATPKRRIKARVSNLTVWAATIEETALVGALPTHIARVVAASRHLKIAPHPMDDILPKLPIRMTWHVSQQQNAGHRWLRTQLSKHAEQMLAPTDLKAETS